MKRGDPPLRNIDKESVGFHRDFRATGSGGEQTDMRAVLEQLQWMNARFDHFDQRMDRLETSQGDPNTRLRRDLHGGRGRRRGGRERPREGFEEEQFGGDLDEGMDETFAVQERIGHGRNRREETDDDLAI